MRIAYGILMTMIAITKLSGRRVVSALVGSSKHLHQRSISSSTVSSSSWNGRIPSQQHHTRINTHATSATCRFFSANPDQQHPSPPTTSHSFRPGDPIQVEVVSFGPLGASVEVIGLGHDGEVLPADAQEPYGTGLILQKEIAYFRQARDNVDVVRGEILPAYVQKVREEDGKLDIALRSYGGKAKSQEVGAMILERLEWTPGGVLNVGEKSSPKDIAQEFPGVSKNVFKKALGGLYKKGLVQPGPNTIELMNKEQQK